MQPQHRAALDSALHINVTPPQTPAPSHTQTHNHAVSVTTLPNGQRAISGGLLANLTYENLLEIANVRWFQNDELLELLQVFLPLGFSVTTSPPTRPIPGSLLFYDRTVVKRWRADGYSWKGSDRHVELKVDTNPVINCCYAHSSERADLHRRSYWLLDENNPIAGKHATSHPMAGKYVMVHYLDNRRSRKRSNSRDYPASSLSPSPQGHGRRISNSLSAAHSHDGYMSDASGAESYASSQQTVSVSPAVPHFQRQNSLTPPAPMTHSARSRSSQGVDERVHPYHQSSHHHRQHSPHHLSIDYSQPQFAHPRHHRSASYGSVHSSASAQQSPGVSPALSARSVGANSTVSNGNLPQDFDLLDLTNRASQVVNQLTAQYNVQTHRNEYQQQESLTINSQPINSSYNTQQQHPNYPTNSYPQQQGHGYGSQSQPELLRPTSGAETLSMGMHEQAHSSHSTASAPAPSLPYQQSIDTTQHSFGNDSHPPTDMLLRLSSLESVPVGNLQTLSNDDQTQYSTSHNSHQNSSQQAPAPVRQQTPTLIVDICPSSSKSPAGGDRLLFVVNNTHNLRTERIVAVFGNATAPVQALTSDAYRVVAPAQPSAGSVNVFLTDGHTFTNTMTYNYHTPPSRHYHSASLNGSEHRGQPPPLLHQSSAPQSQKYQSRHQHHNSGDAHVIVQDRQMLLSMIERIELLLSSADTHSGVGGSMGMDSSDTHSAPPPNNRIPSLTTAVMNASATSAHPLDRSQSPFTHRTSSTHVSLSELRQCIQSGTGSADSESSTPTTSNGKSLLSAHTNDDVIESVMLLLLQRARRQHTLTVDILSSADMNGRQLIHFAAALQFYSMVTWLLNQGINVNAVDSQGRTPLHFASVAGDAAMVTELLAAGADDTIKDKNQETPMQLTARMKTSNIHQSASGSHHVKVMSVFIDSQAAEQPTQQELNAQLTEDEADDILASTHATRDSSLNTQQRHPSSGKRSISSSSPAVASPSSSVGAMLDTSAAAISTDGYLSEGSFMIDSRGDEIQSPDYILPSLGLAFATMTLADMGIETEEIEREVAGSSESFARCVRQVQRKIRSYLYRRHAAVLKVQSLARGYIVRKRLSGKQPKLNDHAMQLQSTNQDSQIAQRRSQGHSEHHAASASSTPPYSNHNSTGMLEPSLDSVPTFTMEFTQPHPTHAHTY